MNQVMFKKEQILMIKSIMYKEKEVLLTRLPFFLVEASKC